MNAVFIVGCGDIGQRVAQLYRMNDCSVRGMARSEESAARLRRVGIDVIRGDLEQRESLHTLPTSHSIVFYFAAPPACGETDPLLKNFLVSIDSSLLPVKLVLVSTTAVYGDCQGAWITEQQIVSPQTARGLRRLDAENSLRRWAVENAVSYVILRVGGIYGPGRLPVVRLKKGLPILAASESPYTNRIHQDDLARVCVAAAERGESGEVYNVADGCPGTMSQYFIDVAQALGLPQPPIVSRAEARQVMSVGMLSYLQESRRMDTRKMRDDLGIELRYPNLAAGLAEIHKT